MNATGPNPVGRPTKYDPKYVELVFNYCLLGATNEQISEFFGVSISTLYLWMQEHEEFSEAVRKGRFESDANVSKALYHRALGYSHKAVKIFATKDGETIEHEYIEHYPPDTAAAFIWLKNRQPKLWRDKYEHTVRRIGSLTDLDEEELAALQGDAEKKLVAQLEATKAAAIEVTAEVVDSGGQMGSSKAQDTENNG